MKIYLDYIVIENFLINLSVLYQTSIFTKTKFKKNRLILVSIFLSLISLLIEFEVGNNIFISILAINISTYLLFIPKNFMKFVKLQMYYYLIYVIYIGVIVSISVFFKVNLNSFTIRILLYIVTIVITYIINKYMWKIWINKIKYGNLTYKIVINSLNKISFKVFVDTGNNIKDPYSNLDVIILNTKMYTSKSKSLFLDDEKKDLVSLDISTANGKSKIKGYIFKDISIKKGGVEKLRLKKAIIVFMDEKINNDQYDGIISYNTYLEKLEGVII